MPYYNRDPEMDHNFDNHPYEFSTIALAEIVRKRRLQGAVKAVKQGGRWEAI